jgi:hypothetical protein
MSPSRRSTDHQRRNDIAIVSALAIVIFAAGWIITQGKAKANCDDLQDVVQVITDRIKTDQRQQDRQSLKLIFQNADPVALDDALETERANNDADIIRLTPDQTCSERFDIIPG